MDDAQSAGAGHSESEADSLPDKDKPARNCPCQSEVHPNHFF